MSGQSCTAPVASPAHHSVGRCADMLLASHVVPPVRIPRPGRARHPARHRGLPQPDPEEEGKRKGRTSGGL